MKKCDIILVTWDHLECTKPCVENILKYTHLPSRLIIVDNGSGSQAKEYLQRLEGNAVVDIILITNEENEGSVRGRNRGMRASRAEYVCLIDNDILVTSGWLSKMVTTAESHFEIGIVNPSSNNFGQKPLKGQSLEEYAKSLEKEKGRYVEMGQCIGFCMLVKRKVIEKIGYQDERFERIFFDDTDYCVMANRAGFRCVMVKDAYVWHHEHKSSGMIKEKEDIFRKNQKRFYQKWGRPLRIVWPVEAGINSDSFRRVLEIVIFLVRQENFVYLLLRNPEAVPPSKIFESLGLIEHARIHCISYKGKFFKLFSLFRILKRQKKKFDLILVENTKFANLLRKFRAFHKADIFVDLDKESLKELCQRKRFSVLS